MELKRGRLWRRVVASTFVVLAIGLLSVSGRATNQTGMVDGGAPRPKRLIVVSWDGAPDWVVDRLLAEGKLPNVARLAASGMRAEASRPAWPSKTACGHAAIWTGAYGDVNGVSGNWVPVLPRSEHTLLEDRSGYHSTALQAEPFWIAAARGGKKVVVLSGTHTFPSDRDRNAVRDAGIPEDRVRTFSGFESKMADGRIVSARELRTSPSVEWMIPQATLRSAREFELSVAESKFFGLVYDDPADPFAGFDTVLIRQSSRDAKAAVAEARIKPKEASEKIDGYSSRFRVTKGSLFGFTYFRLFELAADGSKMVLYQRGVNGLQGLATPVDIEAYSNAYGGFHDEAFFHIYEDGHLGPRIWEGGDGTAERRLLETVRLDVEFRIRGVRYAMETWNPDVVFHYTPTTDSAGHEWIGALDPKARNANPAVAEKLWPFYEEVFRLEDRWLGHLIDAAGPEGVVCLVSDHGMAATDTFFFPNTSLQQAGLLETVNGKIDLERTQACVPPSSDFFVNVNSVDRKGGIVKPADREVVLRRVEDALLSARDPRNGDRIVRAVFRPDETVGMGIEGETSGDLYYDLMPGYYPYSRISKEVVEPDMSAIGSGNHGFFPFRRAMQAICYIGGPGLTGARTVGPIRQIDIAPTLAWMIGVPAPRDARGHAIADVTGFH